MIHFWGTKKWLLFCVSHKNLQYFWINKAINLSDKLNYIYCSDLSLFIFWCLNGNVSCHGGKMSHALKMRMFDLFLCDIWKETNYQKWNYYKYIDWSHRWMSASFEGSFESICVLFPRVILFKGNITDFIPDSGMNPQKPPFQSWSLKDTNELKSMTIRPGAPFFFICIEFRG